MELRHVLESQQFSRELLEGIFASTDVCRRTLDHGNQEITGLTTRLKGKIMLEVFYEPSTRTRFSFAMAGMRLGMNVCWTENAKDFSSAIKGETLEDTIRVLCEYNPDVIVLRHHETGAAARAAAVSSVPIINAGDGQGQHPTQALLDIYTIWKSFGHVDGLKVAMMGDLANGRTVRSLSYLLTKFSGVKIVFISPPDLAMSDDIKTWLTGKGVNFQETDSPFPALRGVDVVYCTRIQKERGGQMSERDIELFSLDKEKMSELKEHSIVMHPLPRNAEIATEVDADHRAAYFKQAGNGMYIRMALLLWVMHEE